MPITGSNVLMIGLRSALWNSTPEPARRGTSASLRSCSGEVIDSPACRPLGASRGTRSYREAVAWRFENGIDASTHPVEIGVLRTADLVWGGWSAAWAVGVIGALSSSTWWLLLGACCHGRGGTRTCRVALPPSTDRAVRQGRGSQCPADGRLSDRPDDRSAATPCGLHRQGTLKPNEGARSASKRILTIVGTRPQLIKAAALQPALRSRHNEVLVDTGQHWDDNLAGMFFRERVAPRRPHSDSRRDAHRADLRNARALEPIVESERPDA